MDAKDEGERSETYKNTRESKKKILVINNCCSSTESKEEPRACPRGLR